MFIIYAKDIDYKIACSERYQETEFLGVYSTLEKAKEQIECHKQYIQESLGDKTIKKLIPRFWKYYICSCELDQPVIIDEQNVLLKTE